MSQEKKEEVYSPIIVDWVDTTIQRFKEYSEKVKTNYLCFISNINRNN